MNSRLPATPLEALSISGALRAAVKLIHTSAHVFGFWKHPSVNAAGDFEEMSLMDKMYWGYKSKNPIRRAEKGSRLETFFKENQSAPSLPDGFQKTHTVTFGGVGDLIKVDGLENSRDHLYAGVADLIFDADISYGNLESQLTSRDMGAYTFSDKETPPLCCTGDQYDTLKEYKGRRYALLHTACNHTLDVGEEGLETTLAQLEKDGIIDLGTNRRPPEQHQARVIQKNGIKIGVISAAFGLNGKAVPPGKEYAVNVIKFHSKGPDGVPDMGLLEAQIADCKARECDFIIASLHWGYEYEFYPRPKQVEIAHTLVEAGVDMIVGHHSHVIQPVEYYRTRRDPDRTAVIAYSLGNLTSSFSAPHLVLSGVLNAVITKGTVKGKSKTLIESAGVTPVIQRETENNGLPAFQVEKLETLTADSKDSAEKEYVAAVKAYAEMFFRHGRTRTNTDKEK